MLWTTYVSVFCIFVNLFGADSCYISAEIVTMDIELTEYGADLIQQIPAIDYLYKC